MIGLMRIALLTTLLCACAAPPLPPAPRPAPSADAMTDAESFVSDGREIAEAQCSQCHSVGAYGDSPNPAAPHFRTLLSRYHSEVLEQELIEGIRVAHPMPEFQFNPIGTDALIAYLQSIQEPPLSPTDPRAQRPHHVDE